eukprot:CAMPEP_0204900042 /NCGR_PEP_ID=MMETSP1397-20131031/2223_1 /ASSEMBLY_ACC=CAM_ASM_000891 /TAXON_ID=49980 /ORGANISM="Climacostomum Climacostomum virens, Strain Stock W-24" /LENGTH=112 /DNA_ID=CAMNT_0052068105 /DNA_START=95 /DNA_END=433 /DNA_ORIENTATION=+
MVFEGVVVSVVMHEYGESMLLAERPKNTCSEVGEEIEVSSSTATQQVWPAVLERRLTETWLSVASSMPGAEVQVGVILLGMAELATLSTSLVMPADFKFVFSFVKAVPSILA